MVEAGGKRRRKEIIMNKRKDGKYTFFDTDKKILPSILRFIVIK